MSLEVRPIGVVQTTADYIPRHWSISDIEGTLAIDEQYADGLRDIESGQRIVVLFHFDRSQAFSPDHLIQISGDTRTETGVFSTCSPIRPNPIGLSVVEVLHVNGARIDVRGLDMFDGTLILDIKPHVEVNSG